MSIWLFVQTIEVNGEGFTEYVSPDGTKGRTVWFDGYEEIYDL